MKKAPAKSNAVPTNIDEYLADVPEPARTTLNKIRATIPADQGWWLSPHFLSTAVCSL